MTTIKEQGVDLQAEATTLTPTGALRWATKKGTSSKPPVLQQQMQRADGTTFWRKVPIVTAGDDED